MKIRFPFPVVQLDDHSVEVVTNIDGQPLVHIQLHDSIRGTVTDEVMDKAYDYVTIEVVRNSISVVHGLEGKEKKLLEIASYFLRSSDPADHDGRMAEMVRSLR